MLIWLVVPVAVLIWWLLFRTRWGLGLRAVGESPDTVYASGRSARSIRYQALWLGGLLAGVGGAHLAIAYAMNWSENMTAGRGFIAIALVIFAKWDPLRAVAGALLFSGCRGLPTAAAVQRVPGVALPAQHHAVPAHAPGAGHLGRAPPGGCSSEPRARLPGDRVRTA